MSKVWTVVTNGDMKRNRTHISMFDRASRPCAPGCQPDEASVFLPCTTAASYVRNAAKRGIHFDILRSKYRLLVGILDPSPIDDTTSVLGPDAMLALSVSLRALSCLCPGSPGR